MKISYHWLKEWVSLDGVNPFALADRLTHAGLEVEEIVDVAKGLEPIVIVEVLEVKPHPDAQRLHVCKVNVQHDQSALQIVCAATNVKKGLKTVLAPVGACLPNGKEIQVARIRGIESQGMLCSTQDLGMAEESSGIIELPTEAPLGEKLIDYWHLHDHILDVSVTPNRADCLSVLGIAREVGALFDCPLQSPRIAENKIKTSTTFKVDVVASEDCPHYVGRVITHIDNRATTPAWLRERLRRAGLRSIHPVVDVTNYVLLEFGQPLHAFDLSVLNGCIVVRRANLEESLTLLDGKVVDLTHESLIIADAKKPLALAGIMGGMDSGVTLKTQSIFLESAFFQPLTIAKSVRRYQLNTDASQRFERGVDPYLQVKAIERATHLLQEIVGGTVSPLIRVMDSSFYDQYPKKITLRYPQIARILGVEIAPQHVEACLERLGMIPHKIEAGWSVEIPTYRFDVNIEVDLVEEVARLYGYDHLKARRPQVAMKASSPPEEKISLQRVRSVLMDRGYQEIITYSFVDRKLNQLLNPHLQPLSLLNPISADMGVMRTHLATGLISALLYNINRQQNRLRFFEIGACFIPDEHRWLQPRRLGALVYGDAYPEQWGVSPRKVDFFDLKNDLEALLKLTGHFEDFRFVATQTHPLLHAGQAAEVWYNDKSVGYIGALHPRLSQTLELTESVYLFDVDLDSVCTRTIPRFEHISKFPNIRRDIALIVDKTVEVDAILQNIKGLSDEILNKVWLFDIYQGKGIELGKKSIALGLTFQHAWRTLKEEEVNEQMSRIIKSLQQNFNGKLRE